MQFTLSETDLALVQDALYSQYQRFVDSDNVVERASAFHYKHLAMELGEKAVRERRRLMAEAPAARHGHGGTVS